MRDDETEENIYNQDFRDQLLDDDEIDSIEHGFMQGYEEGAV